MSPLTPHEKLICYAAVTLSLLWLLRDIVWPWYQHYRDIRRARKMLEHYQQGVIQRKEWERLRRSHVTPLTLHEAPRHICYSVGEGPCEVCGALHPLRRQCTRPPEGWYCTRNAGHEGPCAAHPQGHTHVPDAQASHMRCEGSGEGPSPYGPG